MLLRLDGCRQFVCHFATFLSRLILLPLMRFALSMEIFTYIKQHKVRGHTRRSLLLHQRDLLFLS